MSHHTSSSSSSSTNASQIIVALPSDNSALQSLSPLISSNSDLVIDLTGESSEEDVYDHETDLMNDYDDYDDDETTVSEYEDEGKKLKRKRESKKSKNPKKKPLDKCNEIAQRILYYKELTLKNFQINPSNLDKRSMCFRVLNDKLHLMDSVTDNQLLPASVLEEVVMNKLQFSMKQTKQMGKIQVRAQQKQETVTKRHEDRLIRKQLLLTQLKDCISTIEREIANFDTYLNDLNDETNFLLESTMEKVSSQSNRVHKEIINKNLRTNSDFVDRIFSRCPKGLEQARCDILDDKKKYFDKRHATVKAIGVLIKFQIDIPFKYLEEAEVDVIDQFQRVQLVDMQSAQQLSVCKNGKVKTLSYKSKYDTYRGENISVCCSSVVDLAEKLVSLFVFTRIHEQIGSIIINYL